jgi:hypothetical protein
MKNRKVINLIRIIIVLVLFVGCNPKHEVDSEVIENIAKYEEIKDVMIPIMDKIAFEKAALAKKGLLISMDLESLEKIVLPQNVSVKNELDKVLTIWKSNPLNKKLSSIHIDNDTTFEFSIKWYNGGILDSSYFHSIVYDPKNRYRQGCSECQDLFLVKTIKGVWKYVICRTNFG